MVAELPRRPVHRASFRRFRTQCQRWYDIGSEVYSQHMHNVQGDRYARAGEGVRDERHGFWRVAGEYIGGEAFDILVYRAPFLNRVHDGAEIVIRQDHIRGFFSNIGTGKSHRNANVRFL